MIPDKILVERVEDYHTHHIGKYAGGNQFWGHEAFVLTHILEGLSIPDGESWEKYRKEYVVLYLFDKEGNFQKAKYQFAGTTDALQFDTESKIEEMIAELDDATFCNIEIKPFKIEIDGFLFGLIPDEKSEALELYPSNTIAFYAPWEGDYST